MCHFKRHGAILPRANRDDPEKPDIPFLKRPCSNKKIERDDESKKSSRSRRGKPIQVAYSKALMARILTGLGLRMEGRNRFDVFRPRECTESPVNQQVGSARSGWRRTGGPLYQSAASTRLIEKKTSGALDNPTVETERKTRQRSIGA